MGPEISWLFIHSPQTMQSKSGCEIAQAVPQAPSTM